MSTSPVHWNSPTILPFLLSYQSRVASTLTSPTEFLTFPIISSSTKIREQHQFSSFISHENSSSYYQQVHLHSAIVNRAESTDLSVKMIHPQHHSPSLSPESSGRLYPFYPTSSAMNGASPSDCARLLSSTPTKAGPLPHGGGSGESPVGAMRPRAATVTTGGVNEIAGLLRTASGIPVSTTATTGSNSAPGVTPLKKSSRRNPWGPETYSDLITVAIHSYPDQQATLQQIYDFIIANYEYFRERSDSTSSAGWKNSIRHNLSLHDRFTKCPKSTDNTKSSYWRINTEVASKPYVRRRACSIDNANLKRSGQHHPATGGGRPSSGHNRSTGSGSTAANGLAANGGGAAAAISKRESKPALSKCAPISNRSPPLPMLCEVPQATAAHPLNLQLPSGNAPAVASSCYLNYSSPAANTCVSRPGVGAGLDDRVTLLGHNMMILGGNNDSVSAGAGTCWPSLPSPKPMILDRCSAGGGLGEPYHYLQQQPQHHHHHHQQQQELGSGMPFGSFRFPSGFGSSSTDQSFRSRTSGLIEQLLRVDDSPSSLLQPASSEQTNTAYLLPDSGLGTAIAPPYFPNSLLVNSSSSGCGVSERRQSLPHDNHHHQIQHYEHARQQHHHQQQQHLPMHVDTAQAVRGNGACIGEPASSPSPIALLKHPPHSHHHQQQQQPHRIPRSPNASVIHHHPNHHHGHQHIHQHLRPVSLHSGANEVGRMGQSSPLTGFLSSSSSTSSTLPWPTGTNGCGAGVYPTVGSTGGADHDQSSLVTTAVNGGGGGAAGRQQQYSQISHEIHQPWSSSSSSFMPNCASEDSNDPFAAINMLSADSSSSLANSYPTVCEAPAVSSGLQSRTSLAMSPGPNTMTYYSRSLSTFTSSAGEYALPYQVKGQSKVQDPPPRQPVTAESKRDDLGCNISASGNSSDLSPLSGCPEAARFCLPTSDSGQQQKHMFQPISKACFVSYPSRIRVHDDELAFSTSDRGHQSLSGMQNSTETSFFDSDEAVKGSGASDQTRDGRSLEVNTEDGVEDCESLELQLSLELADRIVGSSGIGR